jgi:hypothetical protein
MDAQDSSQLGSAAASPERRIAELTILYEVSRALQKTVDEEKALCIVLAGVTAGRGLGFNRAFVLPRRRMQRGSGARCEKNTEPWKNF